MGPGCENWIWERAEKDGRARQIRHDEERRNTPEGGKEEEEESEE